MNVEFSKKIYSILGNCGQEGFILNNLGIFFSFFPKILYLIK
jgi:hypothetical protein